LQKSSVQLRIFEFATTVISQPSVSQGLSNGVKMPCARTLSRTVWQQINFLGHSAEVSPMRAKTNFSDESRSPIRMRICRRDGQYRVTIDDGCIHARLDDDIKNVAACLVTGRF
jgi:hypothetical protein